MASTLGYESAVEKRHLAPLQLLAHVDAGGVEHARQIVHTASARLPWVLLRRTPAGELQVRLHIEPSTTHRVFDEPERHLIDMPHAAFCLFPEGALERFNEKYGHLGLHFMQTGGQLPDGSHFYDIVRGGIDKGAGLADLCEKMGLSLAEAVAAGDSANDVGMLKAAGLGCCMSNGTDEAKAAADRVIGDVREDGLAALIEELWFDGPKAEPSDRSFGSAWETMER